MDEIASFNESRWNDLVHRGVLYSRPYLNLTPETARARIDPFGFLVGRDLRGKDVLCLAAGGGQQTAVFALLGARVHVLDLTDAMLEGDRRAAAHYGVEIGVHKGDMRDLSCFQDDQFDIVWQPYSINFIPDPQPVLREVARVLRPGGFYHLQFHTPFLMGMDERDWEGKGYLVRLPYVDGVEIEEPDWEFEDPDGNVQKLRGPRAFRHTLSRMVRELAGLGFILLRMEEEIGSETDAAPGTWDHMMRVCPPWITVWCAYRPDIQTKY